MNTHIWYIMQIQMTASSISSFTSELQSALDAAEQKIEINLSNAGFIRAELSSLILSAIRVLQSHGKDVYLKGVTTKHKDLFSRNGLFESIDWENTEDSKNTTIKLFEFDKNDSEGVKNYIDSYFLPKLHEYAKNANRQYTLILDEAIRNLQYSIAELINNIQVHSHSKLFYIGGQFYPKKHRISFTILDIGNSIPNTVSKEFSTSKLKNIQAPITLNDVDLINWSTQKGTTTKDVQSTGIPGGAGLYSIKEIVTGFGEFSIASNYGFWKMLSTGKIEKQTLNAPFPGTIVHINFILNMDNLTEEPNLSEIKI